MIAQSLYTCRRLKGPSGHTPRIRIESTKHLALAGWSRRVPPPYPVTYLPPTAYTSIRFCILKKNSCAAYGPGDYWKRYSLSKVSTYKTHWRAAWRLATRSMDHYLGVIVERRVGNYLQRTVETTRPYLDRLLVASTTL